jgi:hypothetical protein
LAGAVAACLGVFASLFETGGKAISGTAPPNEFTDADKRKVADLIRTSGFSCPTAKYATPRGSVEEGASVRVYCAPEGQSEAREDMAYQVIYRDVGAPIVRPGRGP